MTNPLKSILKFSAKKRSLKMVSLLIIIMWILSVFSFVPSVISGKIDMQSVGNQGKDNSDFSTPSGKGDTSSPDTSGNSKDSGSSDDTSTSDTSILPNDFSDIDNADDDVSDDNTDNSGDTSNPDKATTSDNSEESDDLFIPDDTVVSDISEGSDHLDVDVDEFGDTSISDKATTSDNSEESDDLFIPDDTVVSDISEGSDHLDVDVDEFGDTSISDKATYSGYANNFDKKITIHKTTFENPPKKTTHLEIVNTTESEQKNIKLKMESNIGVISQDEPVRVQLSDAENKEMIIKKVDFISSSNQQNVTLQVSNLESKPDEVVIEMNNSDTKKIYKYIDIKLTSNNYYIGESGISTMSFTFTVEKSWVKNNSYNIHTIKMMRYHNDTWQELNTTYLNETDGTIYYEAFTPGLSVFAVVGETIVEDSDAIVEGSTSIPWWISVGIITSSTALLGVVLVKKRFIYHR